MYFLAKLSQAAGLGVMVVGFIRSYPGLISLKLFYAALCLFGLGWLLERFFLKR